MSDTPTVAPNIPKTRKVWRRTDAPSPPLLECLEEPIPHPLPPTSILIKVDAISLNWRDANITHGKNPWPVLPHGIPGCDAVGPVIAAGESVKNLKVGDIVAPITDQASITGREQERTWLAADIDGVLADFLVIEEGLAVRVPRYLGDAGRDGLEEASTLLCAGVTTWTALKGMKMGNAVLIQGTLVHLPVRGA